MESQPTSSKAPLIIGIVAAAVFLFCCICAIAVILLATYTDVLSFLPFFGPKWATASIIPADTGFFVSVNPSVRDLPGYQHLSEVYTEAMEKAGVTDDFEKSLEDLEDELGVSFEEDIQPWLGKELGAAIANFEGVTEGKEPIAVFAAETQDRRASDAFLEKLRAHLEDQGYSVKEETYKDVTYYVQEVESDWETPAVFGTVGKYVVLATDTAAMEDVIDVFKGDADSLAKNENYTGLVKKLPGNAAAIAFYDMQGLLDVALADSGLELSDETSEMLGAYKAFGMAVTLGTEGVQLDFAITFNPEELPQETLEQLESAASLERILQQVPNSALGFIASQIPSNYWENLRTTLEENPELEQQLKDFEDAVGLKIDEELLGWMTGEFAVTVIEAGQADESSTPVGAFAVFETTDLEAAKSAMEDIANAIEGAMSFEFESEDIGGVEMQVLKNPYSEEIMGGYGFTDQHLVIGFTEDALAVAVDESIDPITNDETFKHVQTHLPRKSTGYVYINVEGIWQLIYDSMPEYEQENFDKETRPYLEPIKAIGMAGEQVNPQEGYLQFTAFIYIP